MNPARDRVRIQSGVYDVYIVDANVLQPGENTFSMSAPLRESSDTPREYTVDSLILWYKVDID